MSPSLLPFSPVIVLAKSNVALDGLVSVAGARNVMLETGVIGPGLCLQWLWLPCAPEFSGLY